MSVRHQHDPVRQLYYLSSCCVIYFNEHFYFNGPVFLIGKILSTYLGTNLQPF